MAGVAPPSTLSFADLQVVTGGSGPNADSLAEAVTQFESLFVNMMLKSMRDANAVLSEGSYLHSSEIQMHQQMLDQQLAVHLSEQGGIGLSEPLLRQLSGGLMPAAVDSQQQPSLGIQTGDVIRNTSVASKPPTSVAATIDEAQPIEDTQPTAFASPLEFVQQLLPKFQRALASSAISPVTALAQAALETGWGSAQMQTSAGEPARNLFGIKADNWSGKTAQHQTLEFSNSTPIPTQAAFRAYDSWDESVLDYKNLLSNNPRYSEAMDNAGEPEAFTRALQASGYATDPNYADKILAVLAKVKAMLP